jgi:hypothetical protein
MIMAKVSCPGSETWRKAFGAEGKGLDPLSAIINAFLHLLLQLSQKKDLHEFLAKECEGDCWRRITGPEFERFSPALELEQDGTWTYRLITAIKFQIDCSLTAGPISNEQLMQDLLVELEQLKKESKGTMSTEPVNDLERK